MREKDLKLAEECSRLDEATAKALAWMNDNRSLVADRYEGLLRSIKKNAVEARRLSRAARRPMSVGVFGPSQHGKSFLIGTLLHGNENAQEEHEAIGRVRFGTGDDAVSLNFLNEVNPQGGKETTGLVTRFSVNAIDSPPGFPVCLRLLKEIDLVKIFANSFTFDMSADSINPITHENISNILNQAENTINASFSDNLQSEDIYELEEYFEASLGARHPVKDELAEYFWSRVDRLLPKLQPNERAKVFSILWGEIPEFTALFLELKSALDQLGHPDWAFASLEAIRNREPGKTILHVETMKHGLAPGSVTEMAQLVTIDGKSANLRKPIITALVFELALQIEVGTWKFFKTTDLLDFPGARSRGDTTREKYFEKTADEHPLGEAFLRGKVAVMFDNYSANIDLNTLVACHKAAQLEVSKYPDLVESWVKHTHGLTPVERNSVPVNLFLAITWCDILFEVASGMTDKNVKISNSLNIIDNFSPAISEWIENKKFDNSFLIRNPFGAKQEAMYVCEDVADGGWVETGIHTEKVEAMSEYRNAFLGNDIANGYFANPDEKWDAMVMPNDGGVSYLAEKISIACDQEVKFKQLTPKAAKLTGNLQSCLAPYYEGDGIEERVQKRLAAIEEVIDVLQSQIDLVPRFISEFQMTADLLRQIYVDFKRSQRQGSSYENGMATNIGDAVFLIWVDTMERKRQNGKLILAYSMEPEQFQCVASELEIGARLAKIPEQINQHISSIESYGGTAEQNADQIGITISLMLGDFVSYLGCQGKAKSEIDQTEFFSAETPVETGGLPDFPENLQDMQIIRNTYQHEWLMALKYLTECNASSSSGGLVDVEQNKRLGEVLSLLEMSQRSISQISGV